jgi:hypothetical protein
MLTHFPQAVPEIPVSNVEKVARYYVNALGFPVDWSNDEDGIGGISQGDCRLFLTNAGFHQVLAMREQSWSG